jgi:hypothetical protein
MALDPDEIIVAPTGSVYIAPVGTAPPADTTTPWAAAWKDLGYLSEDAVARSFDSETVDIMAWQADAPVYTDLTLTQTLQFQLMQWNEDTLVFAYGGGVAASGKYSAPAKAAYDPTALGVEIVQGSTVYRMVVARAKITEVGDSNFKGDEAAVLDVTLKVLDNAGAAPWTIIGLTGITAVAAEGRSERELADAEAA